MLANGFDYEQSRTCANCSTSFWANSPRDRFCRNLDCRRDRNRKEKRRNNKARIAKRDR